MEVYILLFPAFELLDAMGPAEVLSLAEGFHVQFCSLEGGLVSSKQGVAIETNLPPKESGCYTLLIPGGQGTRVLVEDQNFLQMLDLLVERSAFCLTVCTGSALLCRTGRLDGRKATSNKRAFSWVSSLNPRVDWQPCARWVVDETYYTSSGISAGIDMALGFVEDRLGEEHAFAIAKRMEYVWNRNPHEDPFSALKREK